MKLLDIFSITLHTLSVSTETGMHLWFALGCSCVKWGQEQLSLSLRGLEDDSQLEFWGADGCVTAGTQEQLGSCPCPPSRHPYWDGLAHTGSEIMGVLLVHCCPQSHCKGTLVTCVGLPGRIPVKRNCSLYPDHTEHLCLQKSLGSLTSVGKCSLCRTFIFPLL